MSRIKLAIVASLGLLVLGCATFQPDLPAITETPTHVRQQGKIVWHDLLTNTPEQSQQFYGELFGWEFESVGLTGGAYTLIRHQGQLIGGMVDTNALGEKGNISQWIAVLSVEDMQTAIKQVATKGGTVLTPPTDMASRGTLAVIEDPQGAFFALLQSRDGDPVEAEPIKHGFLWDELWTRDVAAATDFYNGVLAYQVEGTGILRNDNEYNVFKSGDIARAGVLSHPFTDVRPIWANYLWVDDPAAITAQVENLGGEILLEAQKRAIGGRVALIAGPSGAGIALQTWPLNQEH